MKNSYSVPRNVFLHLLMMSMLYVNVIALIVLFTAYINVMFPDFLNYYSDFFSAIRSSSSIIIVAFPVFVVTNWLISKDVKLHGEVEESRIRKWLMYLTLFASAITIIVYLIRLVFNFYNGELTLPFFLKILVVILITAVVFVYYLLELHRKIKGKRVILFLVSGFILISIGMGFLLVGTPGEQRKVRLDEQRVNDLSNIQWQIVSYWQNKGKLPETLNSLQDPISGMIMPVDPLTGMNYIYEPVSATIFKLCAEFQTSNNLNDDSFTNSGHMRSMNGLWQHEAGFYCFEKPIDPDVYSPNVPKKTGYSSDDNSITSLQELFKSVSLLNSLNDVWRTDISVRQKQVDSGKLEIVMKLDGFPDDSIKGSTYSLTMEKQSNGEWIVTNEHELLECSRDTADDGTCI